MNFETMNKQRKFILLAATAGILGMFLPWIRISFFGITSGSINGMHDWGILTFLCFIAAGGVALSGDQTRSLNKTPWMITMISGGIAALFMVIFFIRAMDVSISFLSFGFYLSLIAALVLLYASYAYRALGYNIKDGFDSLKGDIEKKTKNDQTPPPTPPVI